MNELLYDLYEKLYTPLAMSSQKAEIYECHHKLIEVLDKPERKLMLTIMDIKDKIADELAFDSFICGFNLALQISTELRLYKKHHWIVRKPSTLQWCLLCSGKITEKWYKTAPGSYERSH